MLRVNQSFGNSLGIKLSPFEGGVSVVMVEVGGCFLLANFVEVVSRDVVYIHEGDACLFGYIAAPTPVCLVTTLDVELSTVFPDGVDKATRTAFAFMPLVARGEGEQDGDGTFLLGIANHLLEIPAIGVDDLELARTLHAEHLTRVARGTQHTTFFAILDASDVVVTKLNEHVVAWFKRVIDHFPKTLVDKGASGTSRPCLILEDALGGVEDGVALAAPTPHAVGVLVFVLACGVATKEDHRFAGLSLLVATLGSDLVVETGFQRSHLRVVGGKDTLSGTLCIHAGTIGGGVDFVEIEVIVGLPRAILFEFGGRDVVQVDNGRVGLLADGEDGRREIGEFTLNPLGVILLIVVARGESEEDGCGSLGTNLVDEAASVATKRIDGLLLLGHLIINRDGVFLHFEFAIGTVGRTGTNGVDGAIVIVSEFEEDKIALLHGFENRFPQLVVESARRSATQSMVLDGNFVFIVVFVGIESPSPLTIVAIAEGTSTHGTVAHEEEHRVVALTTASRDGTCLVGDVDGVGCEVTHTIDVNPDVMLGGGWQD